MVLVNPRFNTIVRTLTYMHVLNARRLATKAHGGEIACGSTGSNYYSISMTYIYFMLVGKLPGRRPCALT